MDQHGFGHAARCTGATQPLFLLIWTSFSQKKTNIEAVVFLQEFSRVLLDSLEETTKGHGGCEWLVTWTLPQELG